MSVSKTLLLAVSVLAIASVSNAATQKATAKKSTAKAAAKAAPAADDSNLVLTESSDDASADQAARHPAGGSNAAAVLNANSSTPVNKSSTSLPEAIQASAPRKVFGEFYTETYTNYNDISEGKGSPRFDSYAGVKYDFGNARSLSVRQNFDYTGLTDTRTNAFHIQDIAINYTDAKLATIMGDGSLTLIAREYLPTGENSRFLTGNMGAERLYLIAAKSYGKWDLDVLGMAQYTNNTKDSYFKDGKEAQNRWGYATYEFDSLYNFNSKFAAGLSLEVEHLMFRHLAGSPDSTADAIIEPLIQFTPAKGIAIQAALVNQLEIEHPTQAQALGRAEELQAYFNLAATL